MKRLLRWWAIRHHYRGNVGPMRRLSLWKHGRFSLVKFFHGSIGYEVQIGAWYWTLRYYAQPHRPNWNRHHDPYWRQVMGWR